MNDSRAISGIDLTNPDEIPDHFSNRLATFHEQLAGLNSIDQMRDNQDFQVLLRDIADFLLDKRILCYHFTRAHPDSIKSSGLLLRTGVEIREKFFTEYGKLFTSLELSIIKSSWRDYFDTQARKARDRVIHFVLTMKELNEGGVHNLLTYFGGEQIYFALLEHPAIAEKLKSLGNPLMIWMALPASEIALFDDLCLAKILASSYHRRINHASTQLDGEGKIRRPVNPSELKVIPLPNF